jgi:hypothetical protein
VVRGADEPPLPRGGNEMIIYISLRLFGKRRFTLLFLT